MKKIIFITLLTGLNIMTFSQTANEYYKKGKIKQNMGDYQGAVSDFDKAIEIYSNGSIFNRLTLGQVYYMRGSVKVKLLRGQKDGGCLDYKRAAELGFEMADEEIKKYCD